MDNYADIQIGSTGAFQKVMHLLAGQHSGHRVDHIPVNLVKDQTFRGKPEVRNPV